MRLTKNQVKYVENNLKEKTIVEMAKDLSKEAELGYEERILRQDIINYFKKFLDRDIVREKFEG